MNEKAGGSTKYINQRDEDFLNAILKEPHYRKEFTQALNTYLDLGNFKYAIYTSKIYECIFKENAVEYKKILNLSEKENARDTMYSEVLKLIASFETGLAHEMKEKYNALRRKLTKNYINTVSQSDFERFLGDKSKALEERIDENIDVFKRLKNR